MKREVDNELIEILIDCFRKLGNTSIPIILGNLLDGDSVEDSIDELVAWNLGISDIEEDDGEKKEEEFEIPKLIFLTIGGGEYRMNLIRSLVKEEKYSYSENVNNYLIILNKTGDTKTPYGNETFIFDSEEERDREFNLIKDKMALHNNQFI